jgi:protein-disulfide isomerase
VTELGSAPVPDPGPDDHLRGDGPDAILYLDLACPHCAADWLAIRDLGLTLCVRHFPIASKRPRAPILHAATEAAAAQGGEAAFWSFWDSLMEDRAHTDDPHLWRRAEGLGLDLDRFQVDRRGDVVRDRVARDFSSGIRAGVVGTPAAFVGGEAIRDEIVAGLRALAR